MNASLKHACKCKINLQLHNENAGSSDKCPTSQKNYFTVKQLAHGLVQSNVQCISLGSLSGIPLLNCLTMYSGL